MINTVFFGTHEFAVTILQALLDDKTISVDLVITQPDKPVGRKQEVQKSPVKLLAEKHNLKIDQPQSLKGYTLEANRYTLGITAQYGKIIPSHIIGAPEYGTLNIHTSLLPKYRGASPIQSALINGDTETGVTIMKMDEGLDTGPILLQKSLNIAPDDIYLTLDKKLAQIGAEALLEAVPVYVAGDLKPQPQDDASATTCSQLSREDGEVDWKKSANEIYNQYRGMSPWPGIWTMLDDKRLKLLDITLSDKKLNPGLVSVENDRIYIGCGQNGIEITHLQLEGKKAMDAKVFLQGHKVDGVTLT